MGLIVPKPGSPVDAGALPIEKFDELVAGAEKLELEVPNVELLAPNGDAGDLVWPNILVLSFVVAP